MEGVFCRMNKISYKDTYLAALFEKPFAVLAPSLTKYC
jgi:hypothetical protein